MQVISVSQIEDLQFKFAFSLERRINETLLARILHCHVAAAALLRSALGWAVGRHRQVYGHMTVWRTELAERLAKCGENRTCVSSQASAKVLGSVECAALLEELNAAIDLSHVVSGAHHVQRKLCIGNLAQFWSGSQRSKRGLLPRRQRFGRIRQRPRPADCVVGLSWAAT